MKKLLVFLLAFAFASAGYAQIISIAKKKSSTGTDYTAHANCVGAWYMNADGSTGETDRSGEGYTLAVSTDDTIPTSATVPSGYSGASRDFESGDGDYLYIADASAANLDINGANATVTICAWFNPASLPTSGAYLYMAGKYGNAGYRQYGIAIFESSGSTYASFTKSYNGSTVVGAASTTAISTGTWYHVCGVYDDTNVEIWLNGTREAYTASTDGIANEGVKFVIGGRDTDTTGATAFYDGLIDEVIVFNTALNSTQINEIKNYGISGNKGGSD